MKNLTVKEFNEMHEDFLKKVQIELKLFKKYEKDGRIDTNDYVSKIGINFLEKEELEFDNLDYRGGLDKAIECLQEFKKECEEHSQKIGFNTESDFRTDFRTDDYYVTYIGYTAYWYKVVDEVQETAVNNAFREKVRVLLQPESEDYSRAVDCKLLQLFREEEISWGTLQKLAYSNCNL